MGEWVEKNLTLENTHSNQAFVLKVKEIVLQLALLASIISNGKFMDYVGQFFTTVKNSCFWSYDVVSSARIGN